MLKMFVVVLISFLVAGCSAKSRLYDAPSKENYEKATLEGYSNIRHWGDVTSAYAYASIDRLRGNRLIAKRVDILALSGGAEDGAYGAGFLKGWSQRGDRPEFFMVTGISTGAIIAPFAFAGPKYDDVIKRLYTETSKKNVISETPLAALFGGAAMADTAPLRSVLKEAIDDAFVAVLAREAKRGRVLHIGTTDLDAQRPVVWDITKIAQSGRKDAPELIRNIVMASAAIPGAFPPVLIDVVIDGKRYQELHVDGSVTRQIFVYSSDLDIRRFERALGIHPQKRIWLIRNSKVTPEYKPVSLSLRDISERSISTLVKYHGRSDLANINALAKRDGFEVHLTNVPETFDMPLEEMFDRKYMNALYKTGYERGHSSSAWNGTIKY